MDTITREAVNPLIAQAMAFTEAYRRHSGDHPAIREAACLKTQFPALLGEIRPGDVFAGRLPRRRIAYFATIMWAAFPPEPDGRRSEGKQGGYCFDFDAARKYAQTEEERSAVAVLAQFWKDECGVAKARREWDDDLRAVLLAPKSAPVGGGMPIGGTSTGFCVAVDLDRLVRRGIPGLMEDVAERRARVETLGGDAGFLEGLHRVLDLVVDVCRHYENQARSLAATATEPDDRARYETLAETLSALVGQAPRTLREAIQLVWLFTQMTCTNHPELWRVDGALGDLYAADVDQGRLSEEEAIGLILALWRLVNENGDDAVCRIVVGGKGRRNEANADRFALAAMEATRRLKKVTPQLTLRFSRDQNPALLSKAMEVIGETGVYPLLYNDDTVIPGVAAVLGVTGEEAVKYHPLGCGEYMLACCSHSMLDSTWSIPKTLEGALHDGADWAGRRIGPRTGSLESFDTFDKLYAAFIAQSRYCADISARIYRAISASQPRDCAFLLPSLLTDDCLARGRSLMDGGMRYKGACVMGHGFTNAADSLTAIREVVFRKKLFTLAQVVTALDANFEGFEPIRKALQDAPKFGNDDDSADRMLADMWRDISRVTREAGACVGLDFFIASNVNPGGYWMGQECGASADGRRCGEPFAIGHAPTAGSDKKGLTAMFNSVAKVDAANGGATTNVKLSRDFFTASPAKTKALFSAYFARGGMQANVTVVNRGDLEAAMKAPGQFPHVLVRLGGWSVRFIDLERSVQEEILRRTLY